MKDSLNDEVTNGSTNISELVNKKIYEIEYVLKELIFRGFKGVYKKLGGQQLV